MATDLGRHHRLGAVTPSGIVDLNFCYAVHLAAQGEARPQRVADVLLPANMRELLEAGAISRVADAVAASSRADRGLNGRTAYLR